MSQIIILVKYENVLGNRVPLGQTATYKLPDDAQEAEAWRRLKRDHPDENPMEWRRKKGSNPPRLCECHGKPMWGSLGDGVLVGSCQVTGKTVIRVNPRTGDVEWLDGTSPWTERDDLRKDETRPSLSEVSSEPKSP